MGNKIIVISLGIILSISLIPILVDDVFAGPPTQVGDFRCYVPPNPIFLGNPIPILLTDQFLTEAETLPGEQKLVCGSGDKIKVIGQGNPSESPFDFDHHFTCWGIDAIPLPEPRVVVIKNQFGTFKPVVAETANLICNPATKQVLGGDSFPPRINQHWLCYDIGPFNIAPRKIDFVDQFFKNTDDLGAGVILCNPVTKVDPSGIEFEPQFPDAHLMGFTILSSQPPVNPFNHEFIDQFLFPFQIPDDDLPPELIFIESEKIHPVGGTVLSPDSVSLLLLEAENNAVWWMPAVVIAGAGLALFKIKKKN